MDQAPIRTTCAVRTRAKIPIGLTLLTVAWLQAESVGQLILTEPRSTDGMFTLTWDGGSGPFMVQKKNEITDLVWDNQVATAETTATLPITGIAGYFRVLDLASNETATFTPVLSGDAERPQPVITDGTGSGSFVLEGDTLSFVIEYSGLSGPAVAAHIHGPSPASGMADVLVDLGSFNGGAFGEAGTLIGAVELTPEAKDAVWNGQTYVNVHTAVVPAGEIRGQIAPVLMKVDLNGGNERPDPVADRSPAVWSAIERGIGRRLRTS